MVSQADLEKVRARQHARFAPHLRQESAQVPRLMLMLKVGEDSGGEVSPVTEITGGGAGSSSSAHGPSSFAAPSQPTQRRRGLQSADSAGAL